MSRRQQDVNNTGDYYGDEGGDIRATELSAKLEQVLGNQQYIKSQLTTIAINQAVLSEAVTITFTQFTNAFYFGRNISSSIIILLGTSIQKT